MRYFLLFHFIIFMTFSVQGTVRTTTATGSLSLFLITNQGKDSQPDDKYNKNEPKNPLHRIIPLL